MRRRILDTLWIIEGDVYLAITGGQRVTLVQIFGGFQAQRITVSRKELLGRWSRAKFLGPSELYEKLYVGAYLTRMDVPLEPRGGTWLVKSISSQGYVDFEPRYSSEDSHPETGPYKQGAAIDGLWRFWRYATKEEADIASPKG